MALNYQTPDKSNMQNRALFSDNGNCGYVLKPEFLRSSQLKFSPVDLAGFQYEKFPPWKIRFQILSGQHIPRPDYEVAGDVIDPYVKVRIRGHTVDQTYLNKGKTEHIHNNGFNPVWKSACFEFVVRIPLLAFLEIRVKDHSKSGKDESLASYCVPLRMVQEGKLLKTCYGCLVKIGKPR